MISVVPLSECILSEAAEAGNKGFEDYYVPINMTPDRLVHMLSAGNMSPRFSFTAFANQKPAGLLLNGISTINGIKTAWNGATAVVADYRRLGAGTELMNATMQLYEREEVQSATLECFSVNDRAINMYEKFGYSIQDELIFLQQTTSLKPWKANTPKKYEINHSSPQDVSRLSFYEHLAPWKTQWNNIRNGEAVIVKDKQANTPVGYALFERVFDAEGVLKTIILYQCVSIGSNRENVARLLLNRTFAPLDQACKRMTFNMPSKNRIVRKALGEAGFSEAKTSEDIPLTQAYMVKEL